MPSATDVPTDPREHPMARWSDLWRMPEPSQAAFTELLSAWQGAWQQAWTESLNAWSPPRAGGPGAGWAIARDRGHTPSPRAPREYPPGRSIDQLEVGQQATFTKRVTQEEIDGFALVTGDDNPVHIDEEWAAASSFKGRISHGLLTAGLISATIGTQLPGPGTIYVSQSLRWTWPVRSGDLLTCTVSVKELNREKNRAVLTTVVTCDGRDVLTGEAIVVPPVRAQQ